FEQTQQKNRNPDMEDCGLVSTAHWKTIGQTVCRFPPLALSRSGSCNIEYLFEYSEVGGIHYQLSASAHRECQLFPDMPEQQKRGASTCQRPWDKDFFNMMLLSVPALALSRSGSIGRWR